MTVPARTTASVLLVAVLSQAVNGLPVAEAQLTARRLLASAVTDYRLQYRDIETAVALFREGKIDDARKALAAGKAKNPQLAPVDVMLVQMLFSSGKGAAGLVLLERVVAVQPDDPEAYMMFADLALRQRRLAEAELMFGKGLAVCGEYSQNSTRKKNLLNNALAGMAAVSEARMDWKQAVARLSDWVNADPKNANAHSRLGQAQFRLRQFGKASASFTTSRKIDDQRPLPEISMALLYDQAGERPQAETFIKQAVQTAPHDLNTRLAVVRWALSAGMHELATENLKAAQKLDADSLDVKLAAGLAARYAGNHKQAVGALEAALQQSPRNFEAMNHLALTLIDATDEKERIRALGYAQLNAQIRSDRSSRPAREATVTFAWVLFRLGHTDGAERVLQAILNSGPIGSESAYYAAVMLHDRGRSDISRKILQTALVRGPQFPGRPEAEHMLEHLNQSAAANTPKRGDK